MPAALAACRGIAALTSPPILSSGASADSPPEAAEGLHAVSLRWEYLVDPLGIDTPRRDCRGSSALADMTTAAATVATLNGTVRSRGTRSAETLQLRVSVPVNCRALVPVAGSARPVVREGDRVVWRGGALLAGAAGIGAASADSDYVTFDVGSGSRIRFRK